MKRAEKKLENAKAAYQEELRPIFEAAMAALAINDFRRAAASYQEEIAELAAKPQPQAAPAPIQKIRNKFPQAAGSLSPNGFPMNFASGQADAALEAFFHAQGRYPNREEGRAIISLLNQFSAKDMPKDRLLEHRRYWESLKPLAKGKKRLYAWQDWDKKNSNY